MGCTSKDALSATLSEVVGNGAQGRDRTTDTAIFSRMLYQLSYLGVLAEPERPERAGGL
jgi:hypothetical protein